MKSIFVSSTFKDMQAERNLIRFKVTPEINNFLKEYNDTIEFTDLRWGIDTTDSINASPEKVKEGEEKVLKTCLKEIYKTPYFIGIIGERYGWIPDDKGMVNHVIDVLNTEQEEKYVLENDDISVTNLEIDYGAFFRKHPENCLFYFRKPLPSKKMKNLKIKLENGNHIDVKDIYLSKGISENIKLKKLKDKIEKEFPGRVRYYEADFDEKTLTVTGLEEFEKQIVEDVKEIIKRDFQKVKTNYWQEREEKEIQYMIRQKTEKFTGQKEILNKIDEFMKEDSEKNIFLLTGEAGTGKSAISSRVYQLYKDEYNVVPIFMDNTEHSGNARDILTYQIYQLHKVILKTKYEKVQAQKILKEYLEAKNMLFTYVYNEEKQDIIGMKKIEYNTDISDVPIEILQENLEENLKAYERILNKKMIFIIDAVDQMLFGEEEKEYKWLTSYSSNNIKYIITCLKDTYFESNILPNMKKEEISLLNIEDVREIINHYNEHSTNKMSTLVIDKILEKENITNFLYLSLVLQRFSMFGKYDYDEIQRLGNAMEAINNHMINVVENLPNDLKGLSISILEYANKLFDSTTFHYVLGLIANSRHGLRPTTIEEILKMNNIKYDILSLKIIINFLDSYFVIREDGRIDFSHRIIKEALMERYDKNSLMYSTSVTYNEAITNFLILDFQEHNDILCTQEIIFHLWREWKHGKTREDKKHLSMALLPKLIEIAIKEKNEETRNILARELWKIHMVDQQWLLNSINLAVKSTPSVEYLKGLAEFIFIYFHENMKDNTLSHRLYFVLMKIINICIDKLLQEEQIEENLREIIDDMFFLTYDFVYQYDNEKDEKIKNISKTLELMSSQDKEIHLINKVYTVDYNILRQCGINLIGKENTQWHQVRLKWINEALDNINDKEETYYELLNQKAETYRFLKDQENANKTMLEIVGYYKEKLNSPDKDYGCYKDYITALYDYKRYSNIDKPFLNQSSTEDLNELISMSEECLEFSKEEFRKKNDEDSEFKLALSYTLLGNQYGHLVYTKRQYEEGITIRTTLTQEGEKVEEIPNYTTSEFLYTFDKENAQKCYNIAKIMYEKLIKKYGKEDKYQEYIDSIKEAEIELVKYENPENKKYQSTNDKQESKPTQDLKNIIIRSEELRQKAIDTLKYDDIMEYYNCLPRIKRIYTVKAYENADALYELYEKALIFHTEYVETIYSEKQSEQIKRRYYALLESSICLKIARLNLKGNEMENLMYVLENILEDDYETIFRYRKFQYMSNNNLENKSSIILNKLQDFCKRKAEEFKKTYDEEEAKELIKSLYDLLRKIYKEMLEEDTTSEFEDDKNVALLDFKGNLLVKTMILNDLDLIDNFNVKVTWSTIKNFLEDCRLMLNIQNERYKQNKDKNLEEANQILKDIYVTQKLMIKRIYYTYSEIIDLKFFYETAIKDIKEIIDFQEQMNYLEEIDVYQKLVEQYEKKLKEME